MFRPNDSVTIKLPDGSLETLRNNFSLLIAREYTELSPGTDSEYEQFLADVWVGIVLTLMVLSCVCCMCSCLLYHKFQQWKRSVIEARQLAELEAELNGLNGFNQDYDALPSYTMASGLPTYEEALEELEKVKEKTKTRRLSVNPLSMHRLSVTELFQYYRRNSTGATNTTTSASRNPDPIPSIIVKYVEN